MSEKIKVAWFTDDIDGQARGTSTYSQKLVEQLAINFKDQVELTLIHRQGKCLHPVCGLAKNITIKTIKVSKFSGLCSWLWYFLTGEEEFDIFHVPRHNLYPFFFISRWRGKIKKFMVTVHDAPDKYTPKIYRSGGSWWNWHIKYLARYFIDLLLSESQVGCQQIINYYKIKPQKTAYFFIGCHDHFRQFSSAEKEQAKIRLKEKYNIEPPFFLQVGRFDPHKNVHRLIEALAILKKEQQLPHKLIIIGGRHLESYNQLVEQTITKNQLQDSVIIAPYIEDEDMPALYNLCDLYTYVCLHDGFSIPLVEAMKCGAPIVTSNISVFPEVAGEAGYYVNPFNPQDIAKGILKMLNDDKLRNELVQKGLKRAEIFSWQQAAKDLVEIYKKVLNR